jgi:uncharacterized protein
MTNMTICETVRAHVKEEHDKIDNIYQGAYEEHFVPVVKFAKELAQLRGADEEVVEVAAWLHDIGSLHGDKENHHTYGRDYAQMYLEKLGYPQEKIEMVKHAIFAHRGSRSIARESVEAECVADADAMSHIYDVVSLFRLAFKQMQLETDEAIEFVRSKIERSHKKMSDFGKAYIKERYDAAMLILSE